MTLKHLKSFWVQGKRARKVIFFRPGAGILEMSELFDRQLPTLQKTRFYGFLENFWEI